MIHENNINIWFYSNETVNVEEEEEMNISQEILVLDFGDEKNHDFLRSAEPSADFGKGKKETF